MRAIPGMTVLSPADANETKNMVCAAAKHQGPVYIRITRNDTEVITDESAPFEIGKLYPLTVGDEAVVFATGSMVEQALKAERTLSNQGISVKVINVPTIKPLDTSAIIDAVKGCKAIVVAEEHSKIGGLCSAISESLATVSHAPIAFVAIDDIFGTSAKNHEQLQKLYGLTDDDIVNAVNKSMKG